MKAIFKLNNGNLAILCSKCSVIIKTGKNFTKEESLASKGELLLNSQFCEKCKNMNNRTIYLETQPTIFLKEEYEGSITIENKIYKFTVIYYPGRNEEIEEDIFIQHNITTLDIWDDFPPGEIVNNIEQEIIEQFKKGR